MPRYICHYGGKFFEWSTVIDAPLTEEMSAAEFRKYYAFQYGQRSLNDIEQRMKRAVETGSSAGIYLEEILAENRAGPNETELDFEQVLACVGISINKSE